MPTNIINLFSPSLSTCDSYGVIANQLSRHLAALGVSVNAVSWGKDIPDTVPVSDATIYFGWPTMFGAFPVAGNGPQIAITMFESTVIPDGWDDILNDMDAVIVPSQFCYDSFKACGVTTPLHMIPLGVGEIYEYVERPQRMPMRFLAFLDRGRRKGGHIALEAFQKAFGDSEDHRLVLKVRENVDRIELFKVGNIELVQKDMTEQELYELYCSCDVLIAANSGEGFGLLPREFAKTGGISLATNWGGTADDIVEWGWPIAYDLVPADWAGQPGTEAQDLGVWAKPDVDQLADLLRDIAERRDFYQSQTEAAADNVRQLYSWKAFAEQVYGVFRDIRYNTNPAFFMNRKNQRELSDFASWHQKKNGLTYGFGEFDIDLFSKYGLTSHENH